eukprot:m51a1_g14061 putative endoplasmin homolog (760) ;mRNA; r:1220746-1223617
MNKYKVVVVLAALALFSLPFVAAEESAPGVEKFGFQAEVQRLMKLIINSLYSNKDIFLRELISNGSDALDKIRFLALSNAGLLGTGDEAKLELKIKADPEAGTLTIRDRGIGMTKADLIKNLGTIAHSGTVEFLKSHEAAGQEPKTGSDLIGQFGVGFYSAFLVADRVTVRSKSTEDDQYIWESDANGEFTVRKDESGDSLGRGTEITLHLKPSEKDRYTSIAILKEIATKYSEFINFPIYVWASHEETVPAPEEPKEEEEKVTLDEKKDEEKKEGEEAEKKEDEDETEEHEEAEGPKKTIQQTVWGWEVVNSVKPIWLRSPKTISDEEYNAFYKTISHDGGEPLTRIHFTAEGDHEFRALLYIPKFAPQNLFDSAPKSHENNVRLYVRRVFVTGTYDVMPPYLGFVRGVVDSDDLPLNVGREHLQESKTLDSIKTKLVRKSVQMIQELFKNDTDRTGRYKEFWEQYAVAVKYGIIEDDHNRDRLSKVALFHTTAFADGNYTSLDEYVSRMKDSQVGIYYLAGESYDSVRASPLLERLTRNGFEVLLMHDAADEWVATKLGKYAGKQLINIAVDGIKLDAVDDAKAKAAAERIQKLCDWLKTTLASYGVMKVSASNKLTRTPAAVVSPQWGPSANMQRVLRAHGRGSPMGSSKILELNPGHPIVTELQRRVEQDEKDEANVGTAKALYWTAMVSSGFPIDKDSNEFSTEINALLARSLGVDPNKVEDVPLEKDEAPQSGEAKPAEGEEAPKSEEPRVEL